MTKHPLYRFVVFCLLFGLLFPAAAPAAGSANLSGIPGQLPPGNDILRVVESTSQALTLEVNLPAYQLEAAVSDRGSCSQLLASGWNPIGSAGQPAVPARALLVALPQGATARVVVEETGPRQVLGRFQLCPVSTPLQNSDPSGSGTEALESLRIDSSAYASSTGFPAALVELGQPSFIRSQQVAQLRLQLFQYNPVSQVLTGVSRLRVRVEFGTVEPGTQNGSLDEGPFEQVLQELLINYQQGRSWRLQPVASSSAPASVQVSQPAYKLAVTQDGLEKVTYAALLAAGVPLSGINPHTFRLTNQGREVAIFVQGESDNSFDPGDYLVFYGQKINTRFSDTNIYWLTWGGANGLRMAAQNGAPGAGTIPVSFRSTVHIEQDKSYFSNNTSGSANDHWFWELIIGNSSPVSKSYSFTLKNVATAPVGPAQVRGLLKGFAANPQHYTNIYINGHLIANKSWPAMAEYSFDLAVQQSYLQEGTNTITVEAPMTDGTNPILLDYVLVNWFEVEYAKTYQADGPQTYFNGDSTGTWKLELTGLSSNDQMILDITNPLLPARITGGVFSSTSSGRFTLDLQPIITGKRQYLSVSPSDMFAPASIFLARATDLHSVANAADYIIISHPDFLPAIQPLADYRAARGLRVKVVNVLDIYDEFNGGVFDPQAIKNFIAYAYASWKRPAPLYILLVGDGNYDFKNFLGKNEPNYIPPYLAGVDPYLGEVAADNRYVTVSGTDLLPDLAIGRIPAKTAQEVTNVVNKVLAYNGTISGEWAKKALFVAGKNDPLAGDFPGLSDVLVSEYGSNGIRPIDKIYYGTQFSTPAATRTAVLAAINAGRFMVHYAGHSSVVGWYGDAQDTGNSEMFSESSIPSLTNSGRLPFLVSMTCLVGNFNNPYLRALDEVLILTPDAGTVASWSPVGKGLTGGHDLLDHGLIDAIYHKKVSDIGRATLMAKYYLAATSTGYQDLLDTFVLLGDPALQLPVTWPVFLPLVLR